MLSSSSDFCCWPVDLLQLPPCGGRIIWRFSDGVWTVGWHSKRGEWSYNGHLGTLDPRFGRHMSGLTKDTRAGLTCVPYNSSTTSKHRSILLLSEVIYLVSHSIFFSFPSQWLSRDWLGWASPKSVLPIDHNFPLFVLLQFPAVRCDSSVDAYVALTTMTVIH